MNQEDFASAKEFLEWIESSDLDRCICDKCDVEEWLGALLAYIDAQAAQIEALKDALVEERAYVVSCNEIKSRGIDDTDRAVALQQLAKEMPEVDWE